MIRPHETVECGTSGRCVIQYILDVVFFDLKTIKITKSSQEK